MAPVKKSKKRADPLMRSGRTPRATKGELARLAKKRKAITKKGKTDADHAETDDQARGD